MLAYVSALALFAGAVVAQSGNPITRPLLEVVPACKPFEIKWTPTSTNKINLILLRGPSTNVVPIDTIVEGIENTGSFMWTPSASLEADTTGYGINLTEIGSDAFQYSTQFGISLDDCKDVVSSSSMSGYPTKSMSSAYSTMTPTSAYNTTSMMTATSKYVASTGYPVHNSSIVLPTKSMSVPVSLQTSASATGSESPSASAPVSTGAASPLRAGLGLAGAVAGMVFML